MHARLDMFVGGLVVVLGGLLGASLIAGSERVQYEVRGRVVSVDAAAKRFVVAHEAIPGYMPAMTMAFPVGERAPLEALAPGDGVQFVLRVEGERYWAEQVQAVAAPPLIPSTSPDGEMPVGGVLTVGEAVPSFALTGSDGRPVRSADYRGRVLVVTVIYTRCPLPTYCPRTMTHFADLARRFGKEGLGARDGARPALLAVTLDPEHDTPPVLADYKRRFGARGRTFRLATGELGEVTRLARALGVLHTPTGAESSALIEHTQVVALVDPGGRLAQVWRGTKWRADDVERAANRLLLALPTPPTDSAYLTSPGP